MTEREIPRLPAINIQTPEDFVESRFSQLNSRLKRLIEQDFRGRLGHDINGNYKKDILATAVKLEEIIGMPDDSKPSRYHHNLKVGYALEKYIRFTSEWEGGSICGTDFDRGEFTRVFLEAYSHLDNKEAGKFINEFTDRFKPDIVDEHFWNLVEQVKSKCDSKTVGYFARTLFGLSDYNKFLVEIDKKNDNTTIIQENFTYSFVKVATNVGFELTKAFGRGTSTLLHMEKEEEFKRYAMTTIDIGNKVSGPMTYWLIVNTASLENDDFDYTGAQLAEDYVSIVQKFGKNAGGAYVFGIAGSINNTNEAKSTLRHWFYEKEYYDSRPTCFEDWIKEINESDDPKIVKKFDIKYVKQRKEYLSHINKYFIPQAQDAIPKIDPVVFRETFIKLLINMGGPEASLFSKLSYCDQHYYFNGDESDARRLVKIPDILTELKKSMSEKSYSRMVFYASRMVAHLGIRKICNFIDDVKKCYAEEGEKVTLKRMSGTYARFVANRRFLNKAWEKIDGLLELREEVKPTTKQKLS